MPIDKRIKNIQKRPYNIGVGRKEKYSKLAT